MEIKRNNPNWNKLKEPYKLGEELADYSIILSENAYIYLERLGRLEQSAAFLPNAYKKLKELSIYQKIFIYNLYNRALNIFKEDENLEISGQEQGLNGLFVEAKIGDRKVPIYKLDYESYYDDVSAILYKSVMDKEYNEKQKELLIKRIDEIEDANDPFYFYYQRALKEYRATLKKLNTYEYTDDDYKEVEITKKYHDLMLKEYNIKNDDFIPEKESSDPAPTMEKQLVMGRPNLLVNSNIKYL